MSLLQFHPSIFVSVLLTFNGFCCCVKLLGSRENCKLKLELKIISCIICSTNYEFCYFKYSQYSELFKRGNWITRQHRHPANAKENSKFSDNKCSKSKLSQQRNVDSRHAIYTWKWWQMRRWEVLEGCRRGRESQLKTQKTLRYLILFLKIDFHRIFDDGYLKEIFNFIGRIHVNWIKLSVNQRESIEKSFDYFFVGVRQVWVRWG